MLWGYIAPRYLGDFVPFLVLASAVAMADIWRRLETTEAAVRIGAVGGHRPLWPSSQSQPTSALAITPNEEWNTTQVLHYVEAQKVVSDLTGHPLNAKVVRGTSLPPWGPADQLYVIGDCDGMYISNGEDFSTVPSEQLTRNTWMVVELGHAFQHTFSVTFNGLGGARSKSLELVKSGIERHLGDGHAHFRCQPGAGADRPGRPWAVDLRVLSESSVPDPLTRWW